MKDAKKFFTPQEQKEITDAIAEAEDLTSGEIRIHVDQHCGGDIVQRAEEVFEAIGMAQTRLRNGVLLYIAAEEGRFVVLGDTGINNKVPEDFWDHIRDEVEESFREGDFLDGTLYFIEEAGERLAEFYPYRKDDVNELPDTISFGEGI